MKKSKFLGLMVAGLLALIPLNHSSEASQPNTSVTLTSDNTLVLNSEVNGESVSAVIAKAKELDNNLNSRLKNPLGGKNKPLYLFLNTPGGSIQSGLELIEALKGLGRPVNTITLFSASMGFQIVQNLDDRLILQNGVLMSHHAAGEFEGSFGGSHPSQMDSRYQLWLDRVRELDEQTVKRTNGKQTYESYTQQYDHEMWLTGGKSVEQGYVDRVVTVKCDASLSGATSHSVSFMGMQVSFDLDACPLNTSPMNVRVGGLSGTVIVIGGDDHAEQVKKEFMKQYEKNQRMVVPMHW